MRLEKIVPIAVSVLSLLVSIIAILLTYFNYQTSIVNVEVQWQSLHDGYRTVDNQIMEFEKSLKVQRDGPKIETVEELEHYLLINKFPLELARLYRERLDKLESLSNAAKHYHPFKTRLSSVDFRLPSTPQLPKGYGVGGYGEGGYGG
jgi:hypothetical protein